MQGSYITQAISRERRPAYILHTKTCVYVCVHVLKVMEKGDEEWRGLKKERHQNLWNGPQKNGQRHKSLLAFVREKPGGWFFRMNGKKNEKTFSLYPPTLISSLLCFLQINIYGAHEFLFFYLWMKINLEREYLCTWNFFFGLVLFGQYREAFLDSRN